MAVVRQRERRRLRWGLGAVAGVVAVAAVVTALHSPLLAARQVTVLGARHSGTAAVAAAAGLLGQPPLIDVDPAAAQRRVEALPWVAAARVERHWPDAVTVLVTERVPVGALTRPGGIALVDGTGRVLAWEPSAPPGTAVLAAGVVPGRPGSVLPVAARPVLAVARTLPPSIALRVQEVVLGAGTVALHLGGGLVAELGSPTGLAAKFAALAGVLARAAPSGPAVIDVSVPGAPTVGPPAPGSSPAPPAS